MKIILILFFAFVACQQNAPTNQTAEPTATVTANIAPNNFVSAPVSPTVLPSAASGVSASDKTKIKTFDGKGVVTKINLELVSVELAHEEIEGLRPTMKMEFYVKEKSELERLKVGDTVEFVLEDDAGGERIIKIRKG
jgi:Cu/Ag efflux protein CusF